MQRTLMQAYLTSIRRSLGGFSLQPLPSHTHTQLHRQFCPTTQYIPRKPTRPYSSQVRASSPAIDAQIVEQYATLPPVHFSDLPLDRAGHLRSDTDHLYTLLHSPEARTVIFQSGKALLCPPTSPPTDLPGINIAAQGAPHSFASPAIGASNTVGPDGAAPTLVPFTYAPNDLIAACTGSFVDDPGFMFLGLTPEGHPVFAVALEPFSERVIARGSMTEKASDSGTKAGVLEDAAALPEGFLWGDVRSEAGELSGGDAAVLALASGLLSFHRSAVFCSRTGGAAAAVQGGHARKALSGQGKKVVRAFYPRVDPAVIVAVLAGDWLLLGRKKAWQAGRYSLLAGFIEVGETLEQAVAREVEEESGIIIDPHAVPPIYLGSQPWPFPSSLMVGFAAHATLPTPLLDTNNPRNPSSGSIGSSSSTPPSGYDLLSQVGRRACLEVGITSEEVQSIMWPPLQPVKVDPHELEDARWFHKDFLTAALSSSDQTTNQDTTTTANSSSRYFPGPLSEAQPVFRIPGHYALAHRVIHSWLKAGSSDTALLPEVAIDQGTFKYVLIRVSNVMTGACTVIVRGDTRAPYHNDIFQTAKREAYFVDPALELQPLGGGRMEHSPEGKWVKVFGYSAAFGQAPHEMTAVLLRKWLPWYDVEVSYDGY